MKSITTLIKWTTCLLLATGSLSAQDTIKQRAARAKQVESFYGIAVKAFENGNMKVAREAINSALALNGRHAHSIALAKQMKLRGNYSVLKRRKRIFESIIIPLIDVSEVSLKDALGDLAKSVETQSKGKVIPNFVIHDKKQKFKNVSINMKLKNVPAGEILNYILRSSGAKSDFGKYTITVAPR